MLRNQSALVPLPTTLDSVDARNSVKRKMEGLVLISGKKDGSKDSERCDGICGGWPVGFGVLYIDTLIESFEVWLYRFCFIEDVQGQEWHAPDPRQCLLSVRSLHGQGYFVRVTFIQASFGT